MQNDWIAIWGAVLSTGLALLRLWELYRNYFNIDVSYNPKTGDEIYIRNLTNRPITAEHWELQWRKSQYSKPVSITMEQDFSQGRRIEPHGSITLRFDMEDYFNVPRTSNNQKLYIKLYFVGKKWPVLKRVY